MGRCKGTNGKQTMEPVRQKREVQYIIRGIMCTDFKKGKPSERQAVKETKGKQPAEKTTGSFVEHVIYEAKEGKSLLMLSLNITGVVSFSRAAATFE